MEFHKATIDVLRAKQYEVSTLYMQTGPDGFSSHQFIRVNGFGMPIEFARDLNRGLVTFAEIAAHIEQFSN